eukprot:9842017-Heterocapsa_arctica.AAC.1
MARWARVSGRGRCPRDRKKGEIPVTRRYRSLEGSGVGAAFDGAMLGGSQCGARKPAHSDFRGQCPGTGGSRLA